MEYDRKRQIKIKIIEAIQEWEDDGEGSLSAFQEAELSDRIFNTLEKEFKK